MVVGCSGSGKSTLARRIGAATDLPVIHLDQHYFRPGWEIKSDEEWGQIVEGFVAQDCWVMDGNYSKTIQTRLKRADTLVFIDMPTWFCLYRVFRRTLLFLGRVREDAAPGCPERFDLEFVGYILRYNKQRRPKILETMKSFGGRSIHLKSTRQIDQFINDFF